MAFSLTGRAVFREGMLGRYGKLVNMLRTEAINSSTEELADLIDCVLQMAQQVGTREEACTDFRLLSLAPLMLLVSD